MRRLKMLARHDPHEQLFDAYAETLSMLARAAEGAEAIALRAFELCLLRQVGLLPDLSQVTLTARAVDDADLYSLRPEVGLTLQPQGLPGSVWTALEAALAHGSMGALHQACTPVVAALRGPLRAWLHYHLGHSSLRTREVWRDMQRLAESPTP